MFKILFFACSLLIVLLTIKNHRFGIAFSLFMPPLSVLIKYFGGDGFIFKSWFVIWILIFFVITLMKFFVDPKIGFRTNKLDVFMFVVFIYGVFQILNSYLWTGLLFAAILNGFRMYYYPIIFYFTLRFYFKTEDDIRFVFNWIIYIAIIACSLTIFEFVVVNLKIIPAIYFPWVQYQAMTLYGASSHSTLLAKRLISLGLPSGIALADMTRPVTLFLLPHIMGTFALFAVVIKIPFVFIRKRTMDFSRVLNVLVFFFLLLGLFLTFSTTSILSFFIICAYLFIKFKRTKPMLASYLIVLIAVLLIIAPEFLFVRVLGPLTGQYAGTSSFVEASLPFFGLFFRNPFGVIFGYGFFIPWASAGDLLQYNGEIFLLDYTYEVGIIGVLFFLIQNFLFFRAARAIMRNTDKAFLKMAFGGLSLTIIVAVLSTAHWNSLVQTGISPYYMAFLALISSFYLKSKDKLAVGSKEGNK